jgi:hypothetical protein
MIERRLEIGEHPVCCSPAAAHGLGILAVETGEVGRAAQARAPAPWPFRNRTVPVEETPRGQLRRRNVSEVGQDIPTRHALDAVGRLAAAAAVISR